MKRKLKSCSDISFAAYQSEVHGHISNSMLVAIALHSLYILDFFANEDWYLRTIDNTHDVRISKPMLDGCAC